MHILQTVSVVQVVTESLKQSRMNAYEQQKRRLERETAQLLFEKKKAERGGSKRAEAAGRYQMEIDQRHEKLEMVEFQISQLKGLPLGTELKERDIQSIVEVKPGDRFYGKTGGTIVVKDSVIVEIRTEE
ncbi:YlqD family protein [Domibacillus sp. DTU_2020_1001157_1_SI_ALB_TIR_016]|uniref:YlqD family protein n=1 Tax=Domibacillus sp. DTU_2020_1001157_1_SI_ALB_TIR_016 TaxID=3077789 RepID=UPI0028EB42B2|nr:YlqD family protein [Domibacillus sp. DTU_2020_1001157_1_SI_ALB_TIR_016]WNS79749.1 YlqD family protein [Domibacillus sp. DTU_2020_1001157_1_SI_ALB_TIR_016]